MTRAEKAGQKLGEAIIEMVHLMYQNNTAENFYEGLNGEIQEELKLRKASPLPMTKARLSREIGD